jgi:hypothetical protein
MITVPFTAIDSRIGSPMTLFLRLNDPLHDFVTVASDRRIDQH